MEESFLKKVWKILHIIKILSVMDLNKNFLPSGIYIHRNVQLFKTPHLQTELTDLHELLFTIILNKKKN